MRAWAFVMIAVVLEVAATLSLKAAVDHPWLHVVVVLGYVGAFTFLGATLRTGMPLGVAYGVWAATGVALTALLSSVVFHEPLTPAMLTGIGMIMAGVLCVELGSTPRAGRPPADTAPAAGTGAPTQGPS